MSALAARRAAAGERVGARGRQRAQDRDPERARELHRDVDDARGRARRRAPGTPLMAIVSSGSIAVPMPSAHQREREEQLREVARARAGAR